MFDPNNPQGSAFSRRGEMAAEEMPRSSSLDVIGELAQRMKTLEANFAELRDIVNSAKDNGEIGFDFAHAAHVLNKHFFHDQPSDVSEPPKVAKFDPFTGEALAGVN